MKKYHYFYFFSVAPPSIKNLATPSWLLGVFPRGCLCGWRAIEGNCSYWRCLWQRVRERLLVASRCLISFPRYCFWKMLNCASIKIAAASSRKGFYSSKLCPRSHVKHSQSSYARLFKNYVLIVPIDLTKLNYFRVLLTWRGSPWLPAWREGGAEGEQAHVYSHAGKCANSK